MIGMVVRGAGETFNLIVPVRRMHTWAKSAKVDWALDPNVPMITEEELKKIPVEDNGVEFSYSRKADAASPEAPLPPGAPGGPTSLKTIMIGNGPPQLGTVENEMAFPTHHLYRVYTTPKVDEAHKP